jgi:UDP-N-acetylmuramate--alanine ligase
MAAHILTQSGRNPTVFCGAAPLGKPSGGQAGRRDFFVVEACEYRKNFSYLRPKHAVILGIEPDHFDCFENLAEIEAAFRRFAELLPVDGLLLYRDDCPSTQKIVQNLKCRTISFGFSPTADWSAKNLQQNGGYYRFSIFKGRDFLAEVQLPVPGRHNLSNALAAAALCGENGASAEEIRHGLETFPGLKRRFEIYCRTGFQPVISKTFGTGASGNCVPTLEHGNEKSRRQVRNLSYVKDYAHHPTEVAAALQTAREVFPNRRIWCIFQPHQASRTAWLLDELAFSLQNADKVIVAEIFRAREGPPRPGEVTAADLARRTAEFANSPHPNPLPKEEGTGIKVLPIYQTDDIIDTLATQVQDSDVIITLGAGDIHDKICRAWSDDPC